MAQSEPTCWTVIEAAAAGTSESREEFAQRYRPVVRAALASRWRNSGCLQELDDAVQDVFVECFKQGGILDRVERGRPGGFRAFLYGVIRNVAFRFETRRARMREQQPPKGMDLNQVRGDEKNLSWTFDRAWAVALLREAGSLMEQRAQGIASACRRVELLRLRFQEGLPIREIAARWQADAAALHHDYARARQEFKATLLEVLAFHHPGSAAETESECTNLLAILSQGN
jgi:RNA polymerase sigma-70 factor (ECF subfamily)